MSKDKVIDSVTTQLRLIADRVDARRKLRKEPGKD